jgi:hypothetical protein
VCHDGNCGVHTMVCDKSARHDAKVADERVRVWIDHSPTAQPEGLER